MRYAVRLKKSAVKELSGLPRREQRRVAAKIDALAHNPRPRGARKLEGEQIAYRIRAGDYRIVYEVRDKKLTVLVIRVRHRKDVYR